MALGKARVKSKPWKNNLSFNFELVNPRTGSEFRGSMANTPNNHLAFLDIRAGDTVYVRKRKRENKYETEVVRRVPGTRRG